MGSSRRRDDIAKVFDKIRTSADAKADAFLSAMHSTADSFSVAA
jgi:hypothetical protein